LRIPNSRRPLKVFPRTIAAQNILGVRTVEHWLEQSVNRIDDTRPHREKYRVQRPFYRRDLGQAPTAEAVMVRPNVRARGVIIRRLRRALDEQRFATALHPRSAHGLMPQAGFTQAPFPDPTSLLGRA
jgi:hypothetical protein